MPVPRARPVRAAPGLPAIGWREWVHLVDLDTWIKAKVDTGALSSALHAFDLRETVERGAPVALFELHPRQRRARPSVAVEAEVVDRRRVRNSGGHQELRPVVLLDIQVADQRWPIEVTLTRRDEMGFRMLLGRRAVRGHFVVDPGASFLCGRRSARPS